MGCMRLIVKLLIIVGALNWGLVGFFQFDLVSAIFGGMWTTGARVVYSVIGLAGLYKLLCCFFCKKSCPCGCHNNPNGHCNCGKK